MEPWFGGNLPGHARTIFFKRLATGRDDLFWLVRSGRRRTGGFAFEVVVACEIRSTVNAEA